MILPNYKNFIKTLPCCHCGRFGVDPHHMIGVDKMGSIGATTSDITLMPLCREDHNAVHADGGKGWPQTKWMIETQLKAISVGVIAI